MSTLTTTHQTATWRPDARLRSRAHVCASNVLAGRIDGNYGMTPSTTKVTFRDEIVEKSGDRALEYVTETTAGAGKAGKLEIPDGFELVLAPFEGAEPRQIHARFRYRLDDGAALFGIVLDQPNQVAKAAFDAEVARIRDHAPFVVMTGNPGMP
jgi:hypothetical protein